MYISTPVVVVIQSQLTGNARRDEDFCDPLCSRCPDGLCFSQHRILREYAALFTSIQLLSHSHDLVPTLTGDWHQWCRSRTWHCCQNSVGQFGNFVFCDNSFASVYTNYIIGYQGFDLERPHLQYQLHPTRIHGRRTSSCWCPGNCSLPQNLCWLPWALSFGTLRSYQ